MPNNKFLSVFTDEPTNLVPPIWLMRQAGRYLKDYQTIRKRAKGFLDLCYTPDLATQVSLQPIQHFGFDAAILFADILLIPHALGQKLWFTDGKGPQLQPIQSCTDLSLDNFHTTLAPVYQTVQNLRQSLPDETALIGFAGAPWTVATYMISGQATTNQAETLAFAKKDPATLDDLLVLLVETTSDYLAKQVECGADCLQIFDSWAGCLSGDMLEKYCFAPNAAIIANLRQRGVNVPIIGFPRGIGQAYKDFIACVPVQAISLDQHINLRWAVENLPDSVIIQGNLDPMVLVEGGAKLDRQIDIILATMRGRKHIFNLGHGVLPQTPPQHVMQLVQHIRKKGKI